MREVQGDLVIARAGGVKTPGRGPDELAQARFDVHVDVFELLAERESPMAVNSSPMVVRAVLNGARVLACNDAGLLQHRRVRARPLQVLGREAKRSKPMETFIACTISSAGLSGETTTSTSLGRRWPASLGASEEESVI